MLLRTEEPRKPVAVIWLHGWGVNFYSPTYVTIGRALAERGLTTISVNTRMHDLARWRDIGLASGSVVEDYWGVTSEGSLDLPPGWISPRIRLRPRRARRSQCRWRRSRLTKLR